MANSLVDVSMGKHDHLDRNPDQCTCGRAEANGQETRRAAASDQPIIRLLTFG